MRAASDRGLGDVLRRAARFWAFVGRCVLDFVFPPQCCVCGAGLAQDERTVCESCWYGIPLIGDQHCVRCGVPSNGQPDGCAHCASLKWSFRYTRVLAPFEDTARQLIHALKYRRKRSLGPRLGGLLAAALRDDVRFGRVDLVLPVPLHRARLKERGYNQSDLLARSLGEALGKPVLADALIRTRNTSAQTQLNAQERRANVAGAFRVRHPEQVAGKHLAVVDDVLTTGATLDACSQALLAAGAQSVFAVVVARPLGSASPS